MHAAVQSAHDAYRHAGNLAPAGPSARPEPVHDAWQWVSHKASEEVYIRGDHLVAIGGCAFFMVAGAICGMWLNAL